LFVNQIELKQHIYLFFPTLQANISPPKKIQQWTNLIDTFVRHLIARYGNVWVESLVFEVWNEPKLTQCGPFWSGTTQVISNKSNNFQHFHYSFCLGIFRVL
jgi:beta-xylosidase